MIDLKLGKESGIKKSSTRFRNKKPTVHRQTSLTGQSLPSTKWLDDLETNISQPLNLKTQPKAFDFYFHDSNSSNIYNNNQLQSQRPMKSIGKSKTQPEESLKTNLASVIEKKADHNRYKLNSLGNQTYKRPDLENTKAGSLGHSLEQEAKEESQKRRFQVQKTALQYSRFEGSLKPGKILAANKSTQFKITANDKNVTATNTREFKSLSKQSRTASILSATIFSTNAKIIDRNSVQPLSQSLLIAATRKQFPRSYSRVHALVNLINGVCVRSHEKSADFMGPVKLLVGEGNNSKMISSILRDKGNVVTESFFSKSNFQWTQLHAKHLVAAAIKSSRKINFAAITELSHLDLRDPDAIVKEVTEARIFRTSSLRLIKELVNCTVRTVNIPCHTTESLMLCNHVRGLGSISQKSNLFISLKKFAKSKKFNVFCIIPKTFLIRFTTFEDDIQALLLAKASVDPLFLNPLIIKPGENSNRGTSISMAYSPQEARRRVDELLRSKKPGSTAIVQFYISNPLLYKQRKFDLRCYGLVVRFSNRISFYWYLDGYARTSSFLFDVMDKTNPMVHLTNEAVQIKSKVILRRPANIRHARTRQQGLLR